MAHRLGSMFRVVPTLIAMVAYIPVFYLVAVAWPLAKTDVRVHRLPNRLTLPALPIAFVCQLIVALFDGQWSRFGAALGCAFVAAVVGVAINRTGALGMGDVKLITAITWALAWFNPVAPLIFLAAAFGLATSVVMVLLVARKARMGSSIALGPYLLAGFVIALALSF